VASVVGDEPVQARRVRSPRAPLTIGLALLPLVVSAVALLRHVGDYRPTGDVAATELRLRDLGRNAVLVGPYSRDGWSHLGPSLYYVLVLPYRLLFSSSLAMAVGALLVNGAAIATMAVVARRRSGTAVMVITLVASGILVRALGAEFVRSPWNPSVTVLPFAALLFLAWAMSCGSVWSLPVASGLATFLVQTHVGYVPLAGPLLVWGAGWLAVLAWRRPTSAEAATIDAVDRRPLTKAAAASLAVLAVLWAPPLIDEIAYGGNLSDVARYFSANDEETHSLSDGAFVVGAQLSVGAPWLTGVEATDPLGANRAPDDRPWPIFLPLSLAAAAYLLARGPTHAARFVLTVGVAAAVGIVAIARTPGILANYRLYWVWVLGMCAAMIVAWAVIVSRDRHGPPGRWAWLLAVGCLAALGIVNSIGAVTADVPERHRSEAIDAIVIAIDQEPHPDGTVIVIRPEDFSAMSVAAGVMLGLERAGADAATPGFDNLLGEHRAHVDPTRPRVDYRIASDEEILTSVDDPTLELVAWIGDATVEDLVDRRATTLELAAMWEAGALTDREYLEAITAHAAGAPQAVAAFRVAEGER
jgi:hypothetical protein